MGKYPTITLKEARQMRDELKKQLALGIDPKVAEQQKHEEEAEIAKQNKLTFNVVGKEWWKKNKENWAMNTRENKKRQLRPFRNAFGEKPINKISKGDIKEVIDVLVQDCKLDSTKRGLRAVREIFVYANICGYCDYDPTLYLHKIIPGQKVEHHSAITDPKLLGELLRKINGCNSCASVKYCLKIIAYLPLRSTEIREVRWKEIDLDNAEWIIPASRYANEKDGGGMKNRKSHRVPLSSQVIELFKELKLYTGDSDFCFPGRGKERCITDCSLLMALKRIGYKDIMTIHGFRTVFSTLCNEHKGEWGVDKDEIEYQLAHSETDQVRDSYNRAEYFDKRKYMMQKWADYIDELRETK